MPDIRAELKFDASQRAAFQKRVPLHGWVSRRFRIKLIACLISLSSEALQYLSLLLRYQRALWILALSSP